MTRNSHPIYIMMFIAIVVAIGLLFNQSRLFAQSGNDLQEEALRLNTEALNLYNAGRYAEAIPMAKSALAIAAR
jgi:hypothetical protein